MKLVYLKANQCADGFAN